jgi:alkylated DNA repair dioxygenase AlkB
MNDLFSEERSLPEGFSYFENFISVQEELQLLQLIADTELHTFNFHGYEAKRKVASFGYDWSFTKRQLTRGKEIPAGYGFLISKVSSHIQVQAPDFSELLVTYYPVGSVINWHRDAPPFDVIAGVSLNADCTFRLRPYGKKDRGRGSILTIPVKRRSLYVIRGAARSEWEHSIMPVKDKRYSLTLRTLKGNY